MTIHAIDPAAVKMTGPPQAVNSTGPAPSLMWIKIADLFVDEAYQRPVSQSGRKNIARIARDFQWTRFSCVIVSPIAGGRYAIVDGQHRVTAAAIVGFEAVPCQIVLAAPGEQAAAFSAINGAVTKMSALQLHKAAIAAGEPEALLIEHVTREAAVRVLRSNKAELQQKPGETMAVRAIAEALKRHGVEATTLALRCITGTKNNVRGGLNATLIAGVCECAESLVKTRRQTADQVLALFHDVLVIRELDKAKFIERQAGTSLANLLAQRLLAKFESAGGGLPVAPSRRMPEKGNRHGRV